MKFGAEATCSQVASAKGLLHFGTKLLKVAVAVVVVVDGGGGGDGGGECADVTVDFAVVVIPVKLADAAPANAAVAIFV